ncbi:DNA internalization-related competence protein ComEC/Rec2 [Desulfomarina sp.]
MSRLFSLLSYHLLPSITLAFILGITSTLFIERFPPEGFPVRGVLFLFLFLTASVHLQKRNRSVYWLILLLFFGLGLQQASQRLHPPNDPNHIYNRITEKREVILAGILETMPEHLKSGDITRIIISLHSLQFQNQRFFTPASGRILLRLSGKWPQGILPGDSLVIRAELKRPQGYLSPGSFNYSRYLARKNIWITGKIRTPLFVRKLANKKKAVEIIKYFPEQLRQNIAEKITRTIAPNLAGLYRAILLGDRSGVDNSLQEQFKAAGVMHVLAISGIHMGILGVLLFFLFHHAMKWSETLLLKFRIKKTAALLSLPILVLYSLITGLNAPVIRAVIMSLIVLAALCIDRQKSSPELLCGAALAILVFSPLQLFTASFQLSFAAVAAILFILPCLRKIVSSARETEHSRSFMAKAGAWLGSALLVSLVAVLATAPISLYYFNRISLVGPVANLVIEPLICLWSLLFGFLSLPFLFILPPLGEVLLQTGSNGLAAAIQCVQFFAALPFSDVYLPTPPVPLILSYYLSLYMFFICRKTRMNNIIPASALICTLLFYLVPSLFDIRPTGKKFSISFLDVGQGSAAFLTLPSGYRLLIDGGGSSYLSATVGRKVIAPYLWQKGISRIDAIIVTHPDADHYNGLPFIVEHFSPSVIWVNTHSGHDPFFEHFLQKARMRMIETRVAKKGEFLEQTRKVKCIANTTSWPGSRKGENNGLIIRAAGENFSVLFPGDIEKKTEYSLLKRRFPLHSDILLSPHHGSATSNSEQFLRKISPRIMVVSAGKTRKKYFPSPGLQQLCRRNDILMLTTAQYGTIEIVSDDDGYALFGHNVRDRNPLRGIKRYLINRERSDD